MADPDDAADGPAKRKRAPRFCEEELVALLQLLERLLPANGGEWDAAAAAHEANGFPPRTGAFLRRQFNKVFMLPIDSPRFSATAMRAKRIRVSTVEKGMWRPSGDATRPSTPSTSRAAPAATTDEAELEISSDDSANSCDDEQSQIRRPPTAPDETAPPEDAHAPLPLSNVAHPRGRPPIHPSANAAPAQLQPANARQAARTPSPLITWHHLPDVPGLGMLFVVAEQVDTHWYLHVRDHALDRLWSSRMPRLVVVPDPSRTERIDITERVARCIYPLLGPFNTEDVSLNLSTVSVNEATGVLTIATSVRSRGGGHHALGSQGNWQEMLISLPPLPANDGMVRRSSGVTFESAVEKTFLLWEAEGKEDPQQAEHRGIRFHGSRIVLSHPGDYVVTIEMAQGSHGTLMLSGPDRASVQQHIYHGGTKYSPSQILRCVVRVIADHAFVRVLCQTGLIRRGTHVSVRRL